MEVGCTPEATYEEMLRRYPGAIAAVPIRNTPKRKPTETEAAELQALVMAMYLGESDADRAEALAAALADPDGALLCYRTS